MYEKSLTIMQSMSQKELDSTNPKIFNDPSRIARIARGSGTLAVTFGGLGRCSVLRGT